MATPSKAFSEAFVRHAPEFGVEYLNDQVPRFASFYQLLVKWNARLHLVAPCSPEEFATRHVLESLLLLKHLPPDAAIVDVGSGAGLPVIPCLLARDDLKAILVESSRKKTVFLKEALRAITSPQRAEVVARRFEEIAAPPAKFLTCRALDRFAEKLPELIEWAEPRTMFCLFVGEELRDRVASLLRSVKVEQMPLSEKRFLVIGSR